jgi:hypothetical protein
MSGFEIVEKVIGRTIESCIQKIPTGETISVPFDKYGSKVNLWTPSYDMFVEIALQVANLYRRKQTFKPAAHELWPYVEVYSSLSFAAFLPKPVSDKVLEADRNFRATLLGEGQTVYNRAREALLFSDGVQVLDPFLSLSGRTIEAAVAKEYADRELPVAFPAYTQLRKNFAVTTQIEEGFDLPEYQVVWAACVQEALAIRPLVRAGVVRLVPGAEFGFLTLTKLLRDNETTRKIFDAVSRRVSESGEESLHPVLRCAQTIADSSNFSFSAPFFFSRSHIEHAQALLSYGFKTELSTTSSRIGVANLSTALRVDVSQVSTADLISIRKDDDLFAKWREIRKDLSRVCLDAKDEKEIAAAKREIVSEWRSDLNSWMDRDASLQKRRRNGAFVWGTVSAVVAGGGAALTGVTSLPVLAALAAGGALSGAGATAHEWVRAKIGDQKFQSSKVAFERHLLAVDN